MWKTKTDTMNKFFAILIISIVMLSPTTFAFADSPTTYSVSVTQSSEPDYIDDVPVRHRTPARPIICTITPDGVNIPSVDTEDIIAYDVFSPAGDCIASFTSEQDFITFIYGINGTFEIRIHIDGYVFHGYVDL